MDILNFAVDLLAVVLASISLWVGFNAIAQSQQGRMSATRTALTLFFTLVSLRVSAIVITQDIVSGELFFTRLTTLLSCVLLLLFGALVFFLVYGYRRS